MGSLDCWGCISKRACYHTTPKLAVVPTIFGDTVTGPLDYAPKVPCLKTQAKEDTLESSLTRLWELDKTPETPKLKSTDEATVYHFQDTHQVMEDGRYKVRVPRKADAPLLGESRKTAIKRFLQNERSLKRKRKLQI